MSADPAAADRPRERLRALGPRILAARELVALLVGSGTAGGTAAAVAVRILGVSEVRCAGWPLWTWLRSRRSRAWARRPLRVCSRRSSSAGVRRSRSRRSGSGSGDRRTSSSGSDRGFAICPREEFHALLLDTRHRVLREALVTQGTLDASLISPREVFRLAIAEGAAAVIIAHNHPSGDPTPSPDDRAVTRQIAEAGRALGIPVLDHVIVGDGRFASLANERGCV